MLPRLRPPKPNNTAPRFTPTPRRTEDSKRETPCLRRRGVIFFAAICLLRAAWRRAFAGRDCGQETWYIEVCTQKERNGGKQPCTMKLFHQTPVSAHADPQASPENAKADMAITISAVCKDRRACIATLQKVVEKPNRPHNTRGPRPSRIESDTTASRDVVTTRHGASS